MQPKGKATGKTYMYLGGIFIFLGLSKTFLSPDLGDAVFLPLCIAVGLGTMAYGAYRSKKETRD